MECDKERPFSAVIWEFRLFKPGCSPVEARIQGTSPISWMAYWLEKYDTTCDSQEGFTRCKRLCAALHENAPSMMAIAAGLLHAVKIVDTFPHYDRVDSPTQRPQVNDDNLLSGCNQPRSRDYQGCIAIINLGGKSALLAAST